jgi:hypothetical protein
LVLKRNSHSEITFLKKRSETFDAKLVLKRNSHSEISFLAKRSETFDAKRSETKRNEAKFLFQSFAKFRENLAKLDEFRLVSLGTETFKEAKMGHPTLSSL